MTTGECTITISAQPACGKPGRFITVSENGVGELHRDTIDPNSARARKAFAGETMRAAFKGVSPDDWPSGVWDDLRKQLLLIARVPPGGGQAAPGRNGCNGSFRGGPDAAPEPWPDPVDGVQLLDDLRDLIRTYMVVPDHAAEAIALWIVHTYVAELADYTPYLWVSSPARECGKSTLLELLLYLVWRGQLSDGITAAALYRRIHRASPTILMDELDARLKGDGGEALRGVLNTGFHRGGKVTICVGDQHEDTDFNTFCPKVLAGIGRLWDTVVSRSIPIRLRRASKEELKGLKKIRGDHIAGQLQDYRRRLLRYACDVREKLTGTQTVTPEELSARQCDIWRPLLTIATVTGGHWNVTAPGAALAIHKHGTEETDNGLLLLEDLRALFIQDGGDALFSERIVQVLSKQEDRPWSEYRGDKPITKNGVAYLLKRFEVKPTTVRVGSDVAKGYRLIDLAPVFRVYLTPPTPKRTVTTVTSEEAGQESAPDEPSCNGCNGSSRGGPPPPPNNTADDPGGERWRADYEGDFVELMKLLGQRSVSDANKDRIRAVKDQRPETEAEYRAWRATYVALDDIVP